MTDFRTLLSALTCAATAHGAARLTLDLDIVYQRTPANIARLMAALQDLNHCPNRSPKHPTRCADCEQAISARRPTWLALPLGRADYFARLELYAQPAPAISICWARSPGEEIMTLSCRRRSCWTSSEYPADA